MTDARTGIGCLDRPAAIAARYGELVTHFVIDEADRSEGPAISNLGLDVGVCDTLDDVKLARTLRRLVA